MVRLLTLLLMGLSLVGCAGILRQTQELDAGQGLQASKGAEPCEVPLAPEQRVKLEIIRQLMDSGKHHAALAHLSAAGLDTLQTRYLRAEILRQTGRAAEAIPLYQGLLEGCLAGGGYHGLGLIAGREGRVREAINYLSEARTRLPTNPKVRNDLGYALLLDGQYETARHEFMTALELSDQHPLASRNLLLLLYLEGREQAAKQFAEQMQIGQEEAAKLRVQANQLKVTRPTAGDKATNQLPPAQGQNQASFAGHHPENEDTALDKVNTAKPDQPKTARAQQKPKSVQPTKTKRKKGETRK